MRGYRQFRGEFKDDLITGYADWHMDIVMRRYQDTEGYVPSEKKQELFEKVKDNLNKLTIKQQMLMALFLNGANLTQIADIRGIKPRTLTNQYHLTIKSLQRYLIPTFSKCKNCQEVFNNTRGRNGKTKVFCNKHCNEVFHNKLKQLRKAC